MPYVAIATSRGRIDVHPDSRDEAQCELGCDSSGPGMGCFEFDNGTGDPVRQVMICGECLEAALIRQLDYNTNRRDE